jgi:hypothetical protein
MRLLPKSAVLRTDDPPGHPIGLGGSDLACFEKEKGFIGGVLCEFRHTSRIRPYAPAGHLLLRSVWLAGHNV